MSDLTTPGPACYGPSLIAYVKENPGQTSDQISRATACVLIGVERLLGFAAQGKDDTGQPALHGRCIRREKDAYHRDIWFWQPPGDEVRALLEEQFRRCKPRTRET